MTTVTIELNSKLDQKLARLSHQTRLDRSALVTEAVQQYVNNQLGVIAGINRGLADLDAGRVISYSAAMDQIDDMLKTYYA